MEMDKQTFLNLAPEYYMLAFFQHLEYPQNYYSERGLLKDFTYASEDNEEYCYLESEPLRTEALRLLLKHDAIKIIHDPFGPTLWQRGEGYDELQQSLLESPISPFYKARMSGEERMWLSSALINVNNLARQFKITEDDFTSEPVDEWAPITISQSEPEVAKAVKELEAATEAIEQDNGYAVSHPQERDSVVQDLKSGLEKLKSETISAGWVRRTVQALKIASGRFVNTVKGQTIDGAMLAIKEFVKTHMSAAMEYLWSLLP
ncbi:hypothetical protein V1283_002976 [Bradyrhizobium sp. AZCC 2262]|uniref:hypothetical protein n=1 Tax=Bradyrhizobium sp. AZCC 2262 TaxID=3117022 RepID=UPI002FEE9B46